MGMQLDFRTNKWRETLRPLNSPQHCMTEYSALYTNGRRGVGDRRGRKGEEDGECVGRHAVRFLVYALATNNSGRP